MRFVVIGASAAGINAIRKLRELNPNSEITLISKVSLYTIPSSKGY